MLAFALVALVGAAAGPAQSQGSVELERLYATTMTYLTTVEAAVMAVKVQGNDLVIVPSTTGTIVAVDPATGAEAWRVRLPAPPGERPWLLATPSKVGEYLFDHYASLSGFGGSTQRLRHLVSAVDLSKGEITSEFPTLELDATKPSNDGGKVVFNPPTALPRAALVNAGRGGGSLGMLYAAYGNAQDIQPWHGWIFEIDIDAWERNGSDAAIRSVMLTTPERECPDEGESGSSDMICGGGVWNFAGPQVVQSRNGYELLVTTGNGELNLNDRNYAQSVLRLTKGLDFDPKCNANKCAAFDPLSPSEDCLKSCKNIFVPRQLPDDPPLRPASGRCRSDSTFLRCLATMDYDLGANGAVRVKLGPGNKVIVQPGKDGALYLIDAEKMGRMYDRDQIVATCGTLEAPCRNWSAGMIRTQPVVTEVDGQKVVIVATHMADEAQPAGVVARKIITDDGGPHFEPLWEAPPFDSEEARERFRGYPSLPILTTSPNGDQYVWVVDTTGDQDTLIGIRVADGKIVIRQPLRGTVDSVRPAHSDGVIYVTSRISSTDVVLEAFQIRQ